MLTALVALLPLVAAASHEIYSSNLNFRSPYLSEPGLALDTREIHARHQAESKVIKRQLAKRQLQQNRPDGAPINYNYVGYGQGVTDWDNGDYIFGGSLNFTHSVASGDPWDTSVLLWTRVEPVGEYRVDIPMCVQYKVFSGEDGQGDVVSAGYALTNADVDFTVKVEATGLQANSWFSYQFSNCANSDEKSPMGRTRTAPGKHATDIPAQRFSIFSCSNYPTGFFNSYSGPVLNQDTDYVVHLGDYIYESAAATSAIGRPHSKGLVLATLDDYRKRYAQYRLDVDLQAMHLQFPIIAIWDDHETANNDWKSGSSASNDSIETNGCAYSNNTVCFSDRAMHAKRAYHEWIPIRAVDLSDEARIFREFKFGDLINIAALDTRKYDRDLTDIGSNAALVRELALQMNTSRSITGPKQEAWFKDVLKCAQEDHPNSWKMVFNQVIFGSTDSRFRALEPNLTRTPSFSGDAWDGYQANRYRILDHIYDHEIDNVAVFTGDTHANWLFEINHDTVFHGDDDVYTLNNITTTENKHVRGQVIEYGGSAVGSTGWGSALGTVNASIYAQNNVNGNPGLLFSEGFHRGYMHVAVNYTHMITTYFGYPNNTVHAPETRFQGAQFVQENGMNMIQRPLQAPVEGYGAIKEGNY